MYELLYPIFGIILINSLGLNLYYTYYQNVDKNIEEITKNDLLYTHERNWKNIF